MYQKFYGLHKPPFRITPDTKLFFKGCDRGAVLHSLCYALRRGEGIVKVVGEVGSGKTLLCRMLPSVLRQGVDWVYLSHPRLSPEQTLRAIACELGLQSDPNADKLSIMLLIQDTLLQRYDSARRVIVLVEEAQGMPLDSLEEIRLLSNLETEDHKLMQIVLFGQPELDQNLSQTKIRQLRERITHGFYLKPLDKDNIFAYLDFRMRAAGYKGPVLFSKKIAKQIYSYSRGLIRRINIIADKMLIIAYADQRYTLTVEDVKEAARDSEFLKKKMWWSIAAMFVLFGISNILTNTPLSYAADRLLKIIGS